MPGSYRLLSYKMCLIERMIDNKSQRSYYLQDTSFPKSKEVIKAGL